MTKNIIINTVFLILLALLLNSTYPIKNLFSFGVYAASQKASTRAGFCGNGIIESGEQCDGSNLGGETCVSLGYAGGTLKCKPDCTFDTSACIPRGGGWTVDTTAPSISDIKLIVGDTYATISWKTNESSLSWIVYGTTTDYGLEKRTTSYVTSHFLTLTNLFPKTTYHYQIKSKDKSGNIGSSPDKNFTTLALGEKPKEVVKKPITEMTVEELRAEIAEIMKQIILLRRQLARLRGEAVYPGVPASFAFQTDLKRGMSGAEVKYLQIILNSDPDTQLAKTGVGSPGKETTYFGPLTEAAVIKFQEKYRGEVLAPWGLSKGTGYVGKTTRGKLNALLAK